MCNLFFHYLCCSLYLHAGVTPHSPVLSLGNWSAMTTICWMFLLLLFWRKSGCSDPNVFIPLSAHGLTSLPRPYRLHSYVLNTHHFPCVAKHHGLATLLLLCGDISLNPGPISFGVVNCRSVRNKRPCINDTVTVHSIDIFAVTETYSPGGNGQPSTFHHPNRFQILPQAPYSWPRWWCWIFYQQGYTV